MRVPAAGLILAGCALFATPVQATTFVGTLKGTITSGTAKFFSFFGWWQDISLAGKSIAINFSASVKKNFYDTTIQTFYPRYVVNTVSVAIDLPAPLDSFGGLQTNDQTWTPGGSASFTGDARKGVFDARGPLPTGSDETHAVHFFFEDPDPTDNKIVGAGIASAFTYRFNSNGPYYHDIAFYDNIKFTLNEGSVRQLPKLTNFAIAAVPEPATWAMMVGGFGLVGAAMRRRFRPDLA